MHPYKVFKDGDIECDGMIFSSDESFAKYTEYTEMCEEYWAKEEERKREDRLLDLAEKYGIRFDI